MVKAFQAAAVQMASAAGDIEENLTVMRQWVQRLCNEHADLKLIVFPEFVTTGFVLGKQAKALAESMDGKQFQSLAVLAAEFGVHIIYGYAERDSDGHIYDSLTLISDQGQRLANYRKIHMTEFEKETFTAGKEVLTVDTALGRIGLLICWDLAFPELVRMQALQGCDLIVASSAWENPYGEDMHKFSQAKAIDNVIHVVVSNSIGTCSGFEFAGKSAIYDPTGNVKSQLNSEAGYALALIDPELQKQHREGFYKMLSERRVDIYG